MMDLWNNITFANKDFLWLLLLVPIITAWYIWKLSKKTGVVNYNSHYLLPKNTSQWLPKFRHSLFVLEMLALSALIVALARPQSSLSWKDSTTEGIDIVISFDVSGSMLAKDFQPNRLVAAKEIGEEFIKSRPNDRIGLVIFSGKAFTQCPLTIDHDVLINLFSKVKNGMIEDGTAIGMGLATAVNRLRDSKAKSKVIILLTDGVNNAGSISPLTAAEIAKHFGIRVYTVGIGQNGTAPMPIHTSFGIKYKDMPVRIDEHTMKKISQLTGGKYFRATGNQKLKEIYNEIDQLEKTKINVTKYQKKNERFFPFALFALLCVLLYFTLKHTIFKSIVN